MPIFEVGAPDGRVFELEGASAPNEQELESIFASMPAQAPPSPTPLPQDPTDQESPQVQKLQSQIGEAQEFEKTTFGKILGGIGKALPGDDTKTSEILQGKLDRRIAQEEKKLGKSAILLENLGDDVKEVAVETAKFLPWVVAPAKGVSLVSGLQKLSPVFKNAAIAGAIKKSVTAASTGAVVGGARFVEELAKGEDIEQSIQSAARAGVSSGAIVLGLGAAGATAKSVATLAKKITPFTKKTTAQVGELLNSIPADDFTHALDQELAGKSILKGPFDSKRSFDAIGKRVQKAVNFLDKQAGKEVGAEKAALRGNTTKTTTEGVLRQLDDMVAEKTTGVESTLEPRDLKIINNFRKKLVTAVKGTPGKTDPVTLKVTDAAPGGEKPRELLVGELNNIKTQIQNALPESAFDAQTVSKISREGQGILKKLTGVIKEEVGTKVPKLAEVNQRFSKIRNLRERVATKLKDENVARNVKNLYNKDTFTQDLFKEIDELAPKGLKFQSRLRNAVVRDVFDQIAPGRGGGSGGAQGFMNNIVRGGVVAGSTAALGPVGGVAAAALVSPAVGGKGIVKGAGKLAAAGKLGSQLGPVLERSAAIAGSR